MWDSVQQTKFETAEVRPKWLRILITFLCAWDFFLIILIGLGKALSTILDRTDAGNLGNTPKLILAVLTIFISGYLASRINEWQEKFLDSKPRYVSFLAIGFLILLMAIPGLYLFF